jgi:hypothetical protein
VIYFIHAPAVNAVKIGYANDPWTRLNKLRTDCPCEVEMVAFTEGDKVAERLLQKRFHGYRQRGEWFAYTGELRDFIDGLEPAEARPRRIGALGPMVAASGMSKSYVSQLMNSKRGSLPAILHLYRTTGWLHPMFANSSEAVVAELAEKIPYRKAAA